MKYFAKEDGNLISGDDRISGLKEVPEPPKDSVLRDGEVFYKWDFENEEFVKQTIPPSPDEVFQLFQEKFIEWEENLDDGLDRLDRLMKTYPTADRALDQGNYDDVKNRINKAVDNSNLSLSSNEPSVLIDILEGKG